MTDTAIVKDDIVTIVLQHKSHLLPSLFPNEPSTVTYTGRVVGRAEFDSKDSIRITGDKSMPVRVIHFSKIILWNGIPFQYTSLVNAPKDEPRTIKVEGSKGNTYTITIKSSGEHSCSCPGYGFRGTCRHIDNLKEKEKNDN